MAIIEQELPAFEEALAQRGPSRPSPPGRSAPGRGVLLGHLLAGAGAIHLAMVPSHAGEWLAEGIAFAVAGWLQLGSRRAVVARPTGGRSVPCSCSRRAGAAWAWSRALGPALRPALGRRRGGLMGRRACVALEAVAIVAARCSCDAPPRRRAGPEREGGVDRAAAGHPRPDDRGAGLAQRRRPRPRRRGRGGSRRPRARRRRPPPRPSTTWGCPRS